jgi:hypothetical protein
MHGEKAKITYEILMKKILNEIDDLGDSNEILPKCALKEEDGKFGHPCFRNLLRQLCI